MRAPSLQAFLAERIRHGLPRNIAGAFNNSRCDVFVVGKLPSRRGNSISFLRLTQPHSRCCHSRPHRIENSSTLRSASNRLESCQNDAYLLPGVSKLLCKHEPTARDDSRGNATQRSSGPRLPTRAWRGPKCAPATPTRLRWNQKSRCPLSIRKMFQTIGCPLTPQQDGFVAAAISPPREEPASERQPLERCYF